MVTKFPVFQRPLKCLSGTQGIELVREEKKIRQKQHKLNLCGRKKMELKSVQQLRTEKKRQQVKGGINLMFLSSSEQS